MKKFRYTLIFLIFPVILKAQISYLGITGDTCANDIHVNYTYTNYSIGNHGRGYNIYKNGSLIRNQFGDNVTGQGYVVVKFKVFTDLIVFVAINQHGILYIDGTIDGGATWKNYGGTNSKVMDILPVNEHYAYILEQSFGSLNSINIARASDISSKRIAVFNIDSAVSNKVYVYDTINIIPYCSQMSNIGFRFKRDNEIIDYLIYSISIPVSIEELVKSNDIIYPNPVNDILFFEITIPTKVIITDCSGRVLYCKTFQSGKNSINVTNFYSGMYYILMQNSSKSESKLIIKK